MSLPAGCTESFRSVGAHLPPLPRPLLLRCLAASRTVWTGSVLPGAQPVRPQGLQLAVHRSQLVEPAILGRSVTLEVRTRSLEFALGRHVPTTFGLQRGVELGERRNRIGEFGLQLPTALDRQRELVAIGERDVERHRLALTALPGAVGTHAVGIRPPLPWPPTLPGDCHSDHRNETQRFSAPRGSSSVKDAQHTR